MRRGSVLVAGVALLGTVAGCTSGGRAPEPRQTPTATITTRVPSSLSTTPISAGPTRSIRGRCPLVGLQAAADTLGQRLGRATVETSAGATVGCTFYPVSPGFPGENLPTGGYPSAKITVRTYADAASARQVLALTSRAAGSPSLQSVRGLTAETYQTRFYPPDGDADWACGFLKGAKLITVTIAERTGQGPTIALSLAGQIASKV